ncbi:MAG: ATP-binding cassette domain-containing protein [Bacillota bacterium]|nr:ATP-binding cassette domain-containing protein [Bacillota bacterium]
MSLTAEQISFAYAKQEFIIKNLTFSLERGEIVGLLGYSGSGKSTLLQLLKGLLQPVKGFILIDGQAGRGKEKIKRDVGLLIQMPERQLFETTVYEDVAFGPQNMGIPKQECQERVRASLDEVGLRYDSYKDRSPHQLSSGEKRRAALAGILAMRPSYLLLDEPTAGLDYEGRQRIMQIVARLKDQNIGILIVSHHLNELITMADRLLVLEKGKVVLQGKPIEIIEDLESYFFAGHGLRPAREVLLGLAKHDLSFDSTSYTPEEIAEQIRNRWEEKG